MRTFIAIELEEETKAQLAEVQAEAEKLCRRGNYTPKENFHLTLHFLGEVQEEDLDYLHEAIYETARRNRPFTMTIDKIGFFPRGNKGILWAGIERSNHLQRLFSTLEKSLEQQGFARERKGLSPHITLGREVEPQRNFTDVQRGVRVEPMRVSVRSISLMESVRRGARLMYVPVFSPFSVDRWKINPSQPIQHKHNTKNTSLFVGLVFFICAKCGRERGILRIEVI